MKRFLKWCLILVSIPLLLAVVALGAVYFLAGTDRGFAIAAREAAERVPGLELDGVGGNVLKGLSGDAIGFENDAFRVDVAGLDSDWRAGCLTQKQFCLDRLVVDEVVFAPKPSDAPPPPASTTDIVLPEISLPIDVTVEELLVRRFVFRPPGDAPEQVIEDIALKARTEPGGGRGRGGPVARCERHRAGTDRGERVRHDHDAGRLADRPGSDGGGDRRRRLRRVAGRTGRARRRGHRVPRPRYR